MKRIPTVLIMIITTVGVAMAGKETKTLDLKDISLGVSPVIHNVKPKTEAAPIKVFDNEEIKAKYLIIEEDSAVKPTSGSYIIEIDGNADEPVIVRARDERGRFYARMTLEMLRENALKINNGKLPGGTIEDYPDVERRGVVEGFYGAPWSHAVRLRIIDYMGRHKMNTYIYGPKDDPYHRTPHWRDPYPADEAELISELADSCLKRGIDFVWAIHPGQDIKWNDEDRNALISKFEHMYDLGVRGFAVFFDDISGAGTNSLKQVELLNYLQNEFVKTHEGVADLIVCPTDYSRLWANPGPDGQLATYGNQLDKSVGVCYTGDFVCSDLTSETMSFVNNLIKRPAFYWWNFPVSDYCQYYLLLGPSYGLDKNLKPEELGGFASNPMEHGIASLPALCGVADYCWNIKSFDPIKSWERGLEDLAGDAYDAYRLFSIHSCESGKGYHRDESWETDTDLGNPVDWGKYDALELEFEKIEEAPEVIRRDINDTLLLREINPWLDQFGKLGRDGLVALRLSTMGAGADPSERWKMIDGILPDKNEKAAYEEHKIGGAKLKPFIDNASIIGINDLWMDVTGEKAPQFPSLCANFKPRGLSANVSEMLDNDTNTYFHSGLNRKEGDYLGLNLHRDAEIKKVTVLQGKNDTDAADIYSQAVIEVSQDGTEWTSLPTQISGGNKVEALAVNPVKGRYVRMRSTEEGNGKHWIAIREFNVETVPLNVGLKIKAALLDSFRVPGDARGDLSLSDGPYWIEVKPNASEMLLLFSSDASEMEAKCLDRKGKTIGKMAIEAGLTLSSLPKGTVAVKINGSEGNLRGWTSF